MDDYAGRLLADRYRLPRLPSEEFELAETRAFDTASGQEVLMRQVPLPEVVEAEVVGDDRGGGLGVARPGASRATRRPADPLVRRAVEAARAAADIPDHPRLDQVFDVFVEADGLWIVSELVAARPLAILLAERTLSTHRAAEVAADLLAALRVVHAHGWVHRNLTSRTVLICDDGRALLTGLAAGAAEEALCGYDPLPSPDRPAVPRGILPPTQMPGSRSVSAPDGGGGAYPGRDTPTVAPGARPRDAWPSRTGALAGYRAGARAGAVEQDASASPRQDGPTALPGPRRDGQPTAEGAESGSAFAPVPEDERYRGPSTALAAERARQARIAMVGAVTERWAPEQAGPVYDHWRLAPPVGPAVDLWALGALLFRTVQGHPPYPEEDGAAALVQMVCGEPPAYAEDCGALRPVVESLLRQDPTERPDVEQLRGWLRSLIRSAPEPDVGRHTISVPSSPEPGAGADPRRLPVPRRRGELVRRRRTSASPVPTGRRREGAARKPRALGWLLVSTVLLGVASAMVYAMLFLPKADESGSDARSSGAPTSAATPSEGGDRRPDESARSPDERQPQTTQPTDTVGRGYTLRKDSAGFRIAVPDGWQRRGENGRGQVRYVKGDYQLIVVAGRDSAATFGDDPMAYQNQKEAELAPYRSSDWSSAAGLRQIDVGGTAMAEGEFSWRDRRGRQVFAQNRAMIHEGGYHLVLVIGPLSKRDTVREHFREAADSYRVTSG